MNENPSPFHRRPGFEGVVVSLADKRWYLRDWHAHDTIEINLVLRGSGHVLLEDRRYPLLPGHLVWLWPGQRHVPAQWSSDMLLWIVEWAHGQLPRLHRARRRDAPPPADPAHPSAAGSPRPRCGGSTACCRPWPPSPGRCLQPRTGLCTICALGGILAAEAVENCAAFHPKLEAAIRLLADPDDSPTQAELARRVGLSPYYLSSLFQRQTGLTIPAYRNRLRLQAFFRRVHAHPEISLLRHALDSGFGSYAQFYRVFVHGLGIPPRQWLQSR
jgi:AraC-like DNA-binding protein/mannose-6-phosphate isomerase-like protein (cupin superfamily)